MSTASLRDMILGPRANISSDYASFPTKVEKQVSLQSSTILEPLVLRMAGSAFTDVGRFGRFCVQWLDGSRRYGSIRLDF
jgi:hypothetical protein